MKSFSFLLPLFAALFLCYGISAQEISRDTSKANLYYKQAIDLYKSKSYDSALMYFDHASLLYEKHNLWRDYLICKTKIVKSYQKLWQFQKALNIIEPAVKKALKYIDENDTVFSAAYQTAGFQSYYMSSLDSALYYWKKTLQIERNVYGENHFKTAFTYGNIGVVYEEASKFDSALYYDRKDLEIKLKLFGDKHKSLASAYNNIGVVYKDLNEFDKALENAFKALYIDTLSLGMMHNYVAGDYINIGILYALKSDFDKALEYFMRSLDIHKEIFGEKHIYTAESYNNIGTLYYDKNEFDLSM